MKFLVSVILTAVLSFISGLYLPWWGIAIVAFLVALLIHQFAWKAFFSGLLGVFFLWAGIAWWIDYRNSGILSQKVAAVLPLGGNSLLLILVTGLIGGLVGGFAAMAGSFLRSGPLKV
jgi:hypothetical protein